MARYSVQERLIIMQEVLKVVEGNEYNIKRTRYGNANEVTDFIVDNILARGVVRTRGALLTQIGACTTGCFVNDEDTKWKSNYTSMLYKEIYDACKNFKEDDK